MNDIADLGAEIGRFYPSPVGAVTASKVRASQPRPGELERSHAHLVIVATSGTGSHLVDFEQHDIEPGVAVHVGPGQIQRFDPGGTFEAVVAIIRPEVCPPDLFHRGEHGARAELGDATGLVAALADDLLRRHGTEPDPGRDRTMVATARLLLHHVARTTGRPPPPAGDGQVGLLRAFREELERSYASTRSVAPYAAAIGTSTRTLTRATGALTGLTPKEIIDERVALEARRLLVHTTDPVATIGARLGFSEATNFTKFFTRLVGRSPHDFRAQPMD